MARRGAASRTAFPGSGARWPLEGPGFEGSVVCTPPHPPPGAEASE